MEALRARLAELEGAAAEAERGLRELQSKREEAAAAEARAGSEADHAQEEVALAESAVGRAHAALARLGGLGVWGSPSVTWRPRTTSAQCSGRSSRR